MNQQNLFDEITKIQKMLRNMRNSTEAMEQNIYNCLDKVNCLECFLLFKMMCNKKGFAGNNLQNQMIK